MRPIHTLRATALALAATVLALLALAGAARAAATAIIVDGTPSGGRISNGDFGADFLPPDGGMGSFDSSSDAFYPAFVAQLGTSAYVGSLRFPGGITAESYDWERAIGPQSQRTDNPIGPGSGPSDSSVGPDEFGRLLDTTGASGVVTTNFGTGTAAEAAAFVQYMTGAPGSSPWAARRVADGHRAPYDVPYWEVGNEEYSTDYWRTGTVVSDDAPAGADCPTVATCLYIFGGSTRFTDQKVVGYADRTAAASVSTGAPNQSFYVAYPPLDTAASPATVEVGGEPWTEVGSLGSAGAGAQDYTLDPVTGQIAFGDGTHGAIPPAGDAVTASYVSGPHDGFNQFYAAMKRANPRIQVCSSDTSTDFIEAMGSTYPYDCLQDHPYVGAGDASPTLPIATYENDVMAAPATEMAAAQALESTIVANAGHPVPLDLTEYGQLIGATPDPEQVPYYLNSLDEALVNASQLADWITLGVPVADRQLLAAELPAPSAVTDGLPGAAPYAVTGGITTPGPQTVVQPTAQYLRLMSPLAGESLLRSRIDGNPTLTTTSTGSAVGAVSVVAGAGGGAVDVVAINRSATAAVPATVALTGLRGGGSAAVTTLDGPSALSDNTAAAPSTVTTSSSRVPVARGGISLTLPAHSISLIRIGGI